jgi:hypothetical protein
MQVAYPSLLITYRTMVCPHMPGHFLVSPQLLTRVSPRPSAHAVAGNAAR